MIDKSPPIISFRKCTRSPSQRQTSSPSTSNVCQARDIIEHDHNPHMQRPSFNQGREPYDPAVCYLLRKPTSHRKTLRLSTTKILKRSQVRIKELLSRPFATISLSLPRLHLQLLVVVKPQRHCRAAWQEKATIPPTMPPRTGLRTGQSGGYVHSTSADLKPYQAANVVCIYRMWGQSHTSYRILPIFRDLCKILCDQSKYPPLHLLHSSSCFCKGAEVAESHLDSSASHRTIRPHGCKKRSPK